MLRHCVSNKPAECSSWFTSMLTSCLHRHIDTSLCTSRPLICWSPLTSLYKAIPGVKKRKHSSAQRQSKKESDVCKAVIHSDILVKTQTSEPLSGRNLKTLRVLYFPLNNKSLFPVLLQDYLWCDNWKLCVMIYSLTHSLSWKSLFSSSRCFVQLYTRLFQPIL